MNSVKSLFREFGTNGSDGSMNGERPSRVRRTWKSRGINDEKMDLAILYATRRTQ